MITTLIIVQTALFSWIMSTQGSNLTFAALCALALGGVPVRWVVGMTILFHICLAFAK